MPAFSARAANSGSLNSSVIISSDTAPSMEPAECDKMRFSSKGISPVSYVTMLQRYATSPGFSLMPVAAASSGALPV